MALQTDNKYEAKGFGNKSYNDYGGNYYGKDNRYKFSNSKYYNPKGGEGKNFKKLEQGKNFDKTEEFYNRNQNYEYKKREGNEEGGEGNEKTPKLIFTNSKKLNKESEEINQEQKEEPKEDTPKYQFTNSKKISEGDNFKEIDIKGDVRK